MATGLFGNIRGADELPANMEVFLHFTPSSASQGDSTLTKLDPTTVLTQVPNPNSVNSNVTFFEPMPGIYTLTLPTANFSQVGTYTILIRPVEIRTTIVDTGVLSAFPNIQGLVFDSSSIPTNLSNFFANNGLTGFKIEYLSDTGKIPNLAKIITSNSFATPVSQNTTVASQKSISYVYNDSSSLVFCTVSPSSTPSTLPNATNFIGTPGMNVIISPTTFNPQMIQIEVTQYDLDSIAVGIFGNQSKSIADGIFTIYNFDNQIYAQYNVYQILDSLTGLPLYEIKSQKTSIDFTKNFNNISSPSA
jgi:hypothetical protein